MLKQHWSSVVYFRLCCCFLLVAIEGGCSSYSGKSEYEQFKEKQSSLVDPIVAAGGTAKKEGRALSAVPGAMQGDGWFIDLHGATITDEVIDSIIKIRKDDGMVFDLNLNGSTITDAQLAKLAEGNVLGTVFILNLGGTGITDAGLDKIENVFCMMELILSNSKATMAGAKRLGERKVKNPQTPKVFQTPPKITL